ncbi:MAG: hypothetical protein QNJ98_13425 [Planctomycetota bacterium]|nr:hypothetical protein [Planctomycetota bacterium]
MPTVRHAHLLLPSSLGLLEYDVLEDAVFVGPAPRGGLMAQPAPFREAKVALTRTNSGYVAKPLPGEVPPEINGRVVTDAVLGDGDRIRIGDQVVLFRTDRGPVRSAPPAAAAAAAAAARPAGRTNGQRGARRSSGERRAESRSNALISLLAAAIILAAAVRAVGHLKTMKEARDSKQSIPTTPKVMEEEPSRASRNLLAVLDYERSNPERLSEAAKRYRAFIDHHAMDAEAEIAQERLRELMERWGEREVLALDEQIEQMIAAQQFNRAERVVREFEERFGATRAGPRARYARERIRTEARTALDELKRMAAVLVQKNPKQAVNLLAGSGLSYPPDLAIEVADLLAVARKKADAEKGTRRRPGRRPKPPAPREPDRPAPPRESPPRPDSGDAGPPPGVNAEKEARDAWQAARDDLLNGKYADALLGYTLMVQRYGKTELYQANRKYIQLGLEAARVGKEGPKALLKVEAEERNGRLTFEYTFNTFEELDDWTQEKPFTSEKDLDIKHERGAVSMAGTSGLLHPIVFLPDVRVEANVTADVAHDFGLIALEESDSYRAVLFNVNNTRFKLKKNDNQKPNPGHLLWYVGQGVWKDADADAHGYIKIAERPSSKLKDGDRVKLELERGGKDRCEAGFGAASDGVHLKGNVRGDDGSTMGSARVGVFVDTGIVRVHQIKISGRVDMAWFKDHVQWLAKGDPGPRD